MQLAYDMEQGDGIVIGLGARVLGEVQSGEVSQSRQHLTWNLSDEKKAGAPCHLRRYLSRSEFSHL